MTAKDLIFYTSDNSFTIFNKGKETIKRLHVCFYNKENFPVKFSFLDQTYVLGTQIMVKIPLEELPASIIRTYHYNLPYVNLVCFFNHLGRTYTRYLMLKPTFFMLNYQLTSIKNENNMKELKDFSITFTALEDGLLKIKNEAFRLSAKQTFTLHKSPFSNVIEKYSFSPNNYQWLGNSSLKYQIQHQKTTTLRGKINMRKDLMTIILKNKISLECNEIKISNFTSDDICSAYFIFKNNNEKTVKLLFNNNHITLSNNQSNNVKLDIAIKAGSSYIFPYLVTENNVMCNLLIEDSNKFVANTICLVVTTKIDKPVDDGSNPYSIKNIAKFKCYERKRMVYDYLYKNLKDKQNISSYFRQNLSHDTSTISTIPTTFDTSLTNQETIMISDDEENKLIAEIINNSKIWTFL